MPLAHMFLADKAADKAKVLCTSRIAVIWFDEMPVQLVLKKEVKKVVITLKGLTGAVLPQSTVWLQGDARDWALMWTSIAIFVYASMHLYRLYAHVYYSLGLRPLIQVLRH